MTFETNDTVTIRFDSKWKKTLFAQHYWTDILFKIFLFLISKYHCTQNRRDFGNNVLWKSMCFTQVKWIRGKQKQTWGTVQSPRWRNPAEVNHVLVFQRDLWCSVQCRAGWQPSTLTSVSANSSDITITILTITHLWQHNKWVKKLLKLMYIYRIYCKINTMSSLFGTLCM